MTRGHHCVSLKIDEYDISNLLWYYLHVNHFGCHAVYLVLSYIILSYQESRPTNHAPWTMWRVKPELLSVRLPCCLPACVCLQWRDVLQSLWTWESQLQVSQHWVLEFRVIDPLRGIHLARVANGYPHKEPIMRIFDLYVCLNKMMNSLVVSGMRCHDGNMQWLYCIAILAWRLLLWYNRRNRVYFVIG